MTKEKTSGAAPRAPSLLDASIPIVSLIVMLSLSVYLYGSDSSGGANQVALLLAGAIAAVIAVRNGYPWKEIEQAIVAGISTAMVAILILLAVGALIGTWMLAGTVPAMIYYGLKLLEPHFFYAATCLICAVASLSIGSSWTVAGTLGVGLMGVSLGLGLSPAITAGAVVSGAYFGDKMSPLSDTTNLAPAVAGTDLFTHVRHMAWTTTPSFVIAMIIYAIIGFSGHVTEGHPAMAMTMNALESHYHLSVLTLVPLVVVFVLAFKRFPALPTILFGALLGGVFAVWLQPDVVVAYADAPGKPFWLAALKGIWTALANGYVSTTGEPAVDKLLSRGGMSSMLSTIWLIICALAFGAVVEHAGMLARLIQSILRAAKSTGALITAVVMTCIGANVIAADQYMSIVVPGKMYRAEFLRRGLHAKNLSRTLEDAGTLSSPLVPWNTCGAYMAATLGIATFSYAPFAFLNLINPFVAILYAWRGFTIERITPQEARREASAAATAFPD